MTIQAADGTTNVTVVAGNAITGLRAADGSINVVQTNGSSITGLYHPCGAWNVFRSTGNSGHQHACGALQVSRTGAFVEGTRKVTVVSGNLT